MTPIYRAIHLMGGTAEAARRLGVSYQAVNKWLVKGRIPPGRVLQIERAVSGQVTRSELCPGIYPPEQADVLLREAL